MHLKQSTTAANPTVPDHSQEGLVHQLVLGDLGGLGGADHLGQVILVHALQGAGHAIEGPGGGGGGGAGGDVSGRGDQHVPKGSNDVSNDVSVGTQAQQSCEPLDTP